MSLRLTREEARLLYEAAREQWIPSNGYADFRSAIEKLRRFVDAPNTPTQEKP